MSATTSGTGAAAMVPLLSRILTSTERLCSFGAEPRRAIDVTLREGDLPHELAGVVRAAWSVAVGCDGSGPGVPAIIDALSRSLALGDMLCSLGVAPLEAGHVLRWVDAPRELESVARDAWAFAVASGAATRVAWSVTVPPGSSGPGAAVVIDALSRILTLAERLRTGGAQPLEAIDVLRWIDVPPELARVIRAAWAFATGLGV